MIRKNTFYTWKHGFTCSGKRALRFYRCYLSAKQRCNNRNDSKYSFYGGKGIKFFWQFFQQFKNNMYKSYLEHIKKFGEKNTTLERIDNNGHYSKENCRWATRKEQARNRKSNRILFYKGENHPIWKWEEILGFPSGILRQRLYRKWPIEKCLTQPIRRK